MQDVVILFLSSCLAKLYIMAFTGASGFAGSRAHSVEVQMRNGEVQHMPLYDLPGTEGQPNRGDMWKFEKYQIFTSWMIALQLEKCAKCP
jgi:hypothetical protein